MLSSSAFLFAMMLDKGARLCFADEFQDEVKDVHMNLAVAFRGCTPSRGARIESKVGKNLSNFPIGSVIRSSSTFPKKHIDFRSNIPVHTLRDRKTKLKRTRTISRVPNSKSIEERIIQAPKHREGLFPFKSLNDTRF